MSRCSPPSATRIRNHATGQTDTARVVWARGSVANGHYVPGHWERPRAHPLPPGPAVVSPGPLPHLLHISKIQGADSTNPPYDTSSPTWSSQVAGGTTYDGSDAHPFEWVSVLNPTIEQDDEVGVAGFAVGVDLSGADLPFTHPFGGDFEFGIVPDAQYAGPARTVQPRPERHQRQHQERLPRRSTHRPARQRRAADGGRGGMVPAAYRAQVGDRVAVYGRWIVDAGHDDFHSEIHPPLLLARARAVNAQEADTYPDASAETLLQLWSRPLPGRAEVHRRGQQEPLAAVLPHEHRQDVGRHPGLSADVPQAVRRDPPGVVHRPSARADPAAGVGAGRSPAGPPGVQLQLHDEQGVRGAGSSSHCPTPMRSR